MVRIAFLFFIITFFLPVYAEDLAGKKVMFIDSYHSGYAWSDGITRGINEILDDTGVELKIHRMDSKRNRAEAYIKTAALKAKQAIEAFAPDIVIISDDNATKYVLQPYFKNADIPFVFCGLNWDASVYGLPYSNTTGMVEVEMIKQLVQQLRRQARGEKIGHLALDSLSARKNIQWHAQSEGIHYDKARFVNSFAEWKTAYRELQKEVDMLVLGNPRGVKDWDEKEVVHFVRRHTEIPTGGLGPGREKYTLLGYVRIPEEQGRWAAKAALKILAGTDPASIPITRNQQGKLIINQALSEKLGITFDPALFKRAEIVWPYQGRKILYVASYSLDVHWAKGIRDSILKALQGTGVEFREFHMDAKRNPSEQAITRKALEARQLIDSFSPDVVIVSDDAAAKFLVSRYYRNADIPFVFIGLNWDASPYGLPAANITGMLEVELVESLLSQLRRYAKGIRVGGLAADRLTQRKNVEYHKKVFGIEYDKLYWVNTFDEWKAAYRKLQQEVDMIIFGAPHGLREWNYEDAVTFAEEYIKIPTGGLTIDQMSFAMIGYVKLPEEHGEWATRTALRILDGEKMENIPVVQNKQGKLMLNTRLLKRLGIVIDRAIYKHAEIIE